METAENSKRTAKPRGKPFPPGQSGNPGGRPKKEWTWRGLLLDAAEKAADEGKTVKEIVAEALLAKAVTGDVAAIKEFGDRIDGKPKQGVELTGEDGGDISHKVVVEFVRPSDGN